MAQNDLGFEFWKKVTGSAKVTSNKIVFEDKIWIFIQ